MGEEARLILLVGAPSDEHVAAVSRALAALGAGALVLDTAGFPASTRLTMDYRPGARCRAVLEDGGPALELGRCSAIWWHRPEPPRVEEGIHPEVLRAFLGRECEAALAGLWQAAEVRWVNHPVRHEVATWKTWQLEAARRSGLAIPRTLVTSDPVRARAFLRACGPRGGGPAAVMKALSAVPGGGRMTRWATEEDLAGLEAVRLAPVVFQEYVDGVDVRATVIGREIFAIELDAHATAHPEDWRKDWAEVRRTARPVRLPDPVAAALLALHDRLGIVYGASDLRRRADGEHVFLEVNPAGRWLFVEEWTGLPITETVARLLAG